MGQRVEIEGKNVRQIGRPELPLLNSNWGTRLECLLAHGSTVDISNRDLERAIKERNQVIRDVFLSPIGIVPVGRIQDGRIPEIWKNRSLENIPQVSDYRRSYFIELTPREGGDFQVPQQWRGAKIRLFLGELNKEGIVESMRLQLLIPNPQGDLEVIKGNDPRYGEIDTSATALGQLFDI